MGGTYVGSTTSGGGYPARLSAGSHRVERPFRRAHGRGAPALRSDRRRPARVHGGRTRRRDRGRRVRHHRGGRRMTTFWKVVLAVFAVLIAVSVLTWFRDWSEPQAHVDQETG